MIAFPLVATLLIALHGDAWTRPRPLLLASLFLVWALRLGLHLFVRIRSNPEDPRYLKLIRLWESRADRNFYFLFLFEGLLVAILSVPLYVAFFSETQKLSIFAWVGAAIFCLALLLEILADSQLSRFRKANAGRGQVCDVGLWKYSRHPNYFFEILVWFSFGVFVLDLSAWGLCSGVVMGLLIYFVTGVPPSEAQSLASRGELYRAYQKRTSILVPWFVKRE